MENSTQAVQIVCSFYSVNMKICRFVLAAIKKRGFSAGDICIHDKHVHCVYDFCFEWFVLLWIKHRRYGPGINIDALGCRNVLCCLNFVA